MGASTDELLLLHGFGGTGRSWDPVREHLDPSRYRARAPDLRGHGERGAARPITWAACAQDVLDALPAGGTLVGYSQGGRLALHAAVQDPARVGRLVLVGATAGIEDDGERAKRRRADEALAGRLERATDTAWIAAWQDQPVFAGTPTRLRAAWTADLARNDPRDLAAALRGLGTGTMHPLWDRLGSLRVPVDVVVGERDAKFLALGRRLAAALPHAGFRVVENAGHGVVREQPAALARLLTPDDRDRRVPS